MLPALALRRSRAHRAPEPREPHAPASLLLRRLLHYHGGAGASSPAAAAPPQAQRPHPPPRLTLRLLVAFRVAEFAPGHPGRLRRAPRLAHALGAIPAQGQRHGHVQRLRTLRRHPVVELGEEAVDERGLEERVGDVRASAAAAGEPPEDALHAEVVPVDGLAGALPHRQEVPARAVGGAWRAEEVEEGGTYGVPRRGRVVGAWGREIVPQRRVAVEGRREGARRGVRRRGAVDDAVEAGEVGVGALAGVAAEDRQSGDHDVGGGGGDVRVGEVGGRRGGRRGEFWRWWVGGGRGRRSVPAESEKAAAPVAAAARRGVVIGRRRVGGCVAHVDCVC